MLLRMLAACEYSQVVMSAFLRKGWDAYSCDILPCEGAYPLRHLQTDIRNVLHYNWDLVIAFPPCTNLAISGARYFARKKQDGSLQKAVDFFLMFTKLTVPYVCIENPVGIMSYKYRRPDTYIQPYDFGHDVSKKTCLWLKNLPVLIPVKHVAPSYYTVTGLPRWGNQTPSGQNKAGETKQRGHKRSRFFEGVAKAMADQWTRHICKDIMEKNK